MKKLIRFYLPVLTWCGFIFLLSSQSNLPGASTAVLDFIFKKSAHMFVYAVLYWLIYRAINADREKPIYLIPLLLCLLYAATDELHQSLTPGRTATFRDIGYDVLGMGISMLKLKKLI